MQLHHVVLIKWCSMPMSIHFFLVTFFHVEILLDDLAFFFFFFLLEKIKKKEKDFICVPLFILVETIVI